MQSASDSGTSARSGDDIEPNRSTRTPVTLTGGPLRQAEKEPTMEGRQTVPTDPRLAEVVDGAGKDLARRLGVDLSAIDVVEVLSVTWPDRGLGCPVPGMVYVQVPEDGLLIRFRSAGRMYQYHSGAGRPPFLCERPASGSAGGTTGGQMGVTS